MQSPKFISLLGTLTLLATTFLSGCANTLVHQEGPVTIRQTSDDKVFRATHQSNMRDPYSSSVMSATMNLNVAAIKFCDKNGGKTMKEVSKNAAAGPQYFGSIQFVDFYFSCEGDLGRAK